MKNVLRTVTLFAAVSIGGCSAIKDFENVDVAAMKDMELCYAAGYSQLSNPDFAIEVMNEVNRRYPAGVDVPEYILNVCKAQVQLGQKQFAQDKHMDDTRGERIGKALANGAAIADGNAHTIVTY